MKGAKTLYIHPKWRWEAINGGLQPQPLHHGLISTRLSPRIAKILPISCVVKVQGCTHMPTCLIERCWNTLYMSNMDVGSNLQWSTASTISSWHHFHPTVTQYCQNLTQLRQCNGVRVHSYAYVNHWKVKKHFIYVHYGCGKKSKVDYSLNHDIMASFLLNSHPELLQTIHSGFSGVTV